jgi:para-nitrobenzyl esterase
MVSLLPAVSILCLAGLSCEPPSSEGDGSAASAGDGAPSPSAADGGVTFADAGSPLSDGGSPVAYKGCAAPVQTASGPLRGARETDTQVCSFKGIPYAAPPVGPLRWTAPRPPAPWTDVRAADSWGPICMQQGPMDGINYDPSKKESEDCLYLNVWRPDKAGSFPVMVWLHGGAYTGGTGNTPIYWGDRLAAQDVVVVTLNYRLGAFGFLALDELRKEDENGSTGNYGTLDQIAALEWVQKNIAGFGGDPRNVTIFGESAGGWSVCTLLATPLGKGLFHRAVIQSGACDTSHSLVAGYKQAQAVAKSVGCPAAGLDCMRKVPAKKLLTHTGGLLKALDFMNHHDHHVLSSSPLDTIRSGSFNKVPLIAGHNEGEFRFTTELIPANVPTLPYIYNLYLMQLLGAPLGLTAAEQDEMLELYPAAAYGYKPIDAISAMISEIAISCPTYLGALAVAGHGPDTWFYRFDYDKAKVGIFLNMYLPMGASHGIEIAFIFNTMDRKPSELALGKLDPAELDGLSKTLTGYWTSFARGGSPQGPVAWSALDPDKPTAQVLDTTITTDDLDAGSPSFHERCAFWDKVTLPGSVLDKLSQQ